MRCPPPRVCFVAASLVFTALTAGVACGASPTSPSSAITWSPTVAEHHPQASGTLVLSTAVFGTYIATQTGATDWTLDLLVLLRGTPGWIAGGQGSSGMSGRFDSRSHATIHIVQGGLEFDLTFDASARSASVNGQVIELTDHCVILVDDVDGAQGLRVVGTRAVDRVMDEKPPPGLLAVFQRYRELAEYLRCEAWPAGWPSPQGLTPWCAAVGGQPLTMQISPVR